MLHGAHLLISPAAIIVLAGWVPRASACPSDAQGAATHVDAEAASVDEIVAMHVAHGAPMIGSNCSYSTGLMARRVLGEGRDWTFVGQVEPTANDLASHVATPYRTRSAGQSAFLVATELLERLLAEDRTDATLALSGRTLDVDGVTYVVLTSYRVVNS
ncbi:MAG: hypothetical protein FJ090_00495 [Deltaproteobacteria bacterium]|nr:hypothetical protein [Deltaproteobacteria bacterium]